MKTARFFLTFLLALNASVLAADPKPPNVIVIVADQLRYQSTGYGGDARAVTPNLDRLAAQGMNLRQCVANTPVCAAWRAAFLTGKYASSTGVAVNELRLNPNQDSIAHMFGRGGYDCDLIGKWHLWAADSNHTEIKSAYTPPGPYRMGFDAFWAGYNFNHENYHAWYFRDTPEPHRIEGFGDAKFVDLACERLREHAKQEHPFFMMLALSAPHDPWTKHNIPPAWYERFKDINFPLPLTWSDTPDPYMDRNADPQKWTSYWKSHMEEFYRGYYALSAAMDEQVGRLLAAIDDAGLRDNTIVVFTSDHGEMLGAHGRVFKMTFYEESARTPLLIRWPGHIPAACSDACISTVDLMPTLLGLAGREIPKAVEGINLSQRVLGKGGPEPAAALLQGMGHTYLWEDGFEWRALRDPRFTYARYLRDSRELLFDNVADPLQQHDLGKVEAHHDDLKRLRDQMNQRLGAIGDTFEKCSWYRDHFTTNRVIVRGARGEFHRQFAADVSEAVVKPLLHPLFADHAVLQRDAKVPVWGWAVPNSKITIRFAGQQKDVTSGTNGKWMAFLEPMSPCATGRKLAVKSEATNEESQIGDVLVGDVWICSGQSNMEMGIGLCKVPNEIAAADFPQIRLLTVPKKISYTPELTLQCAWLPCNPATLMHGGWGGFSAAGYFFGKELHRDLGIPIGLIETCWGGTVCEAWTSREALAPLGDFKSGLEQVEQVVSSPEPDPLGTVMDQWYQANDPGTSKKWFKPETDTSTWKTVDMPANWNACGLPGYEGVVWTQRTFEAPAAWSGRDLILSFGTIGDADTTWINGIVVGRTDYFDQPRSYKVPASAVKTGRNVIAMRVLNAGGGGFFGKPEQLQVYPSGDTGTAVSLAGPWRAQNTANRASTGPALVGNPNICTVLYNGMIAPLVPFAIKGVVWYQGESNAERAYQYRALLPAMVKDWRSRFGVGDFGFHIVSLANYKGVSTEPRDNDWAELREAQAMAAKTLPNCGIAIAIDIGDAADIHPRNKQEIGHRLALSALANTYGRTIEWSGPWYQSMNISDNRVRLSFDHANSGLVAKGDMLRGFAIAGEDRKFFWADAVIDGATVLVSSRAVSKPVAVRYGWDSNPACNLFNKEDLPAVPFRTDNWAGVTQKH